MYQPMRVSLCAFVCVVTLIVSATQTEAATVVRSGFASISNDSDAGTWTISSTGTSLVLGLDASRDFEVVRLNTLSEPSWIATAMADTTIVLGGQTVAFGNRAAGFVYQGANASMNGSTLQLDASFDLPTARVRVTRHYAVTSGAPVFEVWTTIAPLAGTVTVSNLNGFRLTTTAGAVRWINGLQADDPNRPRDAAFSVQQRALGAGERLTLGAEGRSSETTVPWFAIDGNGEEFFAALMWSGAWSLTAARTAAGLDLTLGLASMSTTTSTPLDGPHVAFGVARGGLTAASAALRSFIVDALRDGRAFDPLVTYNTWFAYGVEIDEASMRAEIDGAAALGAELFVMDAGWYTGAGRGGVSDFTSGLGSWQIDPRRFPSGGRALTEYAHNAGLKFGIWVEPERVALSTVGQTGLAQEGWLAKRGGKYEAPDSAQICLGGPAARQWVFDQLVRLIDTVHPDYLKWDNNLWVNCDRSGHGHGTTDGNFAHVNGLYRVLADLRARYPDLQIENVSGGGNRLDLGMLRYSDVAWMDDRSAPSVHVRHNIEGLAEVFPPAYLLSFVMDHPEEPMHDAEDYPLYFRSRMAATLGLCFRTAGFGEDEVEQMTHEIDIYKEIRATLRRASGALLTAQAAAAGGPPWDALQATDARTVLVAAFQEDVGSRETTLRPIGLRSSWTYDVVSVDAGAIGSATGAELMSEGISIVASSNSAAHVLILTPRRTPDR
jgi:alpha-galactosidase